MLSSSSIRLVSRQNERHHYIASPMTAMQLPKQLIDIQRIYCEPDVAAYARGREILAQYPEAERIPVASHWKIPSLHGNAGAAEDWLKTKRSTLVLGTKKSLVM